MDEPGAHFGIGRRTLLLNAGYEPLRVVSWQRAIVLIFQNKVEILEEHANQFIHSVSQQFKVPAVIRLRCWIRTKTIPRTVRFSRSNLYARDEYRCQYCYKRFSEKDLTLDHVVPVSFGGRKSWKNIVTACLECNQRKGNRSPTDMGYKLLKKPEAPKWLPGTIGTQRTKSISPLWEVYLTGNWSKIQKVV